ncbi:MAG: exonuclease SbcCD subunit D [Bacteroidales bacterium]|nr:exonuclease SbcCD subunit D [Bacteroidales bacterium]
MKLLHTSDWHIGQILNFHYDRQEEHQCFLDQLCRIVEQERPDVLIVSGDIYDKNTPGNSSMRFLSDNLLRICDLAPDMPIVLTAGNHDSSSRIESMSGVWRRVNTHFIGAAERVGEEYQLDKHIIEIPGKGWIAAVPYIPDYQNDLYNIILKEIHDRNTQNLPVILMGHTTIGNAIFTAHETTTFSGRDIVGGINSMNINEIDNDYDYLALGHIHTPQTLSNGKARYCGSPVQLNFKEQFPHSVTMVTVENHGDMPQIDTIELEPLRRFYVIPEKPAPLEEALSYLDAHLPEKQGYVQLNILSAERLPSDTENRIRDILSKGEGLLYCDYKCTRPAADGKSVVEKPEFNLSEFREKDPFEIAERYYQETLQTEMDDTLKELLHSVIQEVREENAR